MAAFPQGRSPPERSKLDMSEGQKNRIAREALELLKIIENDLNPEDFTLEELKQERTAEVSEDMRFNLLFGFLQDNQYVLTIDEDEGHYRLNQEKLDPAVPVDLMT